MCDCLLSCSRYVVPLVIALVATSPAVAGSLLGEILVYGGTIRSDANAGFVGPGPVGVADIESDTDSATVATLFGDVITATAAIGAVPAAGAGNADAELETRFEFGDPFGGVPQDTITFTADLTASALSAINSAGEDADAVAGVMGMLQFTASSPVVGFTLPDILIGEFTLPALPATGPFQFASSSVLENGLEVASLGPGDPAVDVDILTGRNYRFQFTFGMQVPFGTDPSAHYEYSAVLVNFVPEPSSVLLVAVALLSLAQLSRTR